MTLDTTLQDLVRGEGEISHVCKALSTILVSERMLYKRDHFLMVTLQASTSSRHSVALGKCSGITISTNSFFQSNKFMCNQNGTDQKDVTNVEPRGGRGRQGGVSPSAPSILCNG